MRHQDERQTSFQNNFWNKLDNDIDEIGKRAKDNLKKYQQQQYDTIKTFRNKTKPSPIIKKSKTIKLDKTSIDNQLTDQRLNRTKLFKEKRKQQEKQKQIKNRLIYLSNEKQKKYNTLQQAKTKYEQLVTIRNKSIREKQYLRKRRASFAHQSKEIVQQRAKTVRSDRKLRDQSVKSYKKLLEKSAQKLREQRRSNQSFIQKEKTMYFQQNKIKAKKTKMSLQNSRQKLSEMSQRKLQIGKINFVKKRSQQLQTLNSKKSRNRDLLQKLKQQTQRISNYRSKAQRQIQNYRVIIGIQQPPKNQSRISSQKNTSRSFYVTAT